MKLHKLVEFMRKHGMEVEWEKFIIQLKGSAGEIFLAYVTVVFCAVLFSGPARRGKINHFCYEALQKNFAAYIVDKLMNFVSYWLRGIPQGRRWEAI